MSDPKFRGVVHVVEESKTYGQNGFRKRLVVLEQKSARFSNYVPFEFTADRCELADQLHEGDEVEIVYRLNGRKWQKDSRSEMKYFLNAEAMSFEVIASSSVAATAGADSVNDQFSEAVEDDEVPF